MRKRSRANLHQQATRLAALFLQGERDQAIHQAASAGVIAPALPLLTFRRLQTEGHAKAADAWLLGILDHIAR